MISIADQAYANPWRVFHPRDKMAFALTTMVISLVSGAAACLAIFSAMSYLAVFRTQVPGRFFLRLYLVPFGFLAIGALSVALVLSADAAATIWAIKLGSYYLGVTPAGLDQASLLLARSGAAVSCLFFLALTTPWEDINGQLERWKVPYLLIEMMTLVYRFIFIFWQQAITIHTAQAARLGHVDFRTSMRSLGGLISSLFIQTLDRTHTMYNSLVARGYTDSLRVLEEERLPTPWSTKLGFIFFDLALIGLVLAKGSAVS